jgi:uncharacterized membrane protein YeaQ/YmgE (transglycosylase-associated protein family)
LHDAKSLIFELAIRAAEALNLSEAARIALLQEVMREAKRNERGGLVTCIVGVVVAVAGFSTTSLTGISFNLGVVGILIAAVGFVVYLYYARVYLRFVGQLASMASKSAVPCPRCAKPLPEGEFSFCPFCGAPIKP